MKNKYDNTLMSLAFETANDSYCKRRKVGAVITRDNRCITNAYNGTCEDEDNNCEEEFIEKTCGSCGCTDQEMLIKFERSNQLENRCFSCHNTNCIKNVKTLKTKDSVVHAEANAIIFASKYGIDTNGCTMYVTTAPCERCATLIYGAGFKEVVYSDVYKSDAGLKLLRRKGIKVRKFTLEEDNDTSKVNDDNSLDNLLKSLDDRIPSISFKYPKIPNIDVMSEDIDLDIGKKKYTVKLSDEVKEDVLEDYIELSNFVDNIPHIEYVIDDHNIHTCVSFLKLNHIITIANMHKLISSENNSILNNIIDKTKYEFSKAIKENNVRVLKIKENMKKLIKELNILIPKEIIC